MATERRKTRLVAASTPLVLTPTPTPSSPPSTGIQKNERIFKNARNLQIRAKHLSILLAAPDSATMALYLYFIKVLRISAVAQDPLHARKSIVHPLRCKHRTCTRYRSRVQMKILKSPKDETRRKISQQLRFCVDHACCVCSR